MGSAEITRVWHDLYIMLGTSAAALVGLFFIATSLHISEVVSNPVFRVRAYNGTLYLLTLLVQAGRFCSLATADIRTWHRDMRR